MLVEGCPQLTAKRSSLHAAVLRSRTLNISRSRRITLHGVLLVVQAIFCCQQQCHSQQPVPYCCNICTSFLVDRETGSSRLISLPEPPPSPPLLESCLVIRGWNRRGKERKGKEAPTCRTEQKNTAPSTRRYCCVCAHVCV